MKSRLSARMEVIRDCDLLGISYEQYMNAPKWWTELMIGKMIIDRKYQPRDS